MLSKWDEAKGIDRDEIYHGFLLPQKLKLLGQIAAVKFEQGAYFFEQQAVEQQIGDYIRDLPNTPTDPEELQLDSEGILRAIELQHGLLTERVQGIFSFSDQIFQQYFTARNIVTSDHLQSSDRALKQLASHVTEPRWREVFLLTVAMLRSADSLVNLMKQRIDQIVAPDPHLQDFLTWASQTSLVASPQPASTCAFYLTLVQTPPIAPYFVLACILDHDRLLNAALDHQMLESTTGFRGGSDDWHFSPEQRERLQQYYDASQLLLECLNYGLNYDCEMTTTVQQQIEAQLNG